MEKVIKERRKKQVKNSLKVKLKWGKLWYAKRIRWGKYWGVK